MADLGSVLPKLGEDWLDRVRDVRFAMRAATDAGRLRVVFLEALSGLPGVASAALRVEPDPAALRFPLFDADGLSVEVRCAHPGALGVGQVADVEGLVEVYAARRAALVAEGRPTYHALQDALIRRLSRVGTWTWNIVDGSVEWSDEVLEMWGLSRATFSPSYEQIRARIHSDDRERWVRDVEACLAGEKRHDVEFRVVRPDGSEVWLAALGDCERDDAGTAKRMLGVVLDITDRKHAEASQERSAERFRSLMQQTVEGFYLFEFDEPVPIHDPPEQQIDAFYRGHIVECNDAFARMYGLESGAELVGMSLVELHGGSDNPENRAFLRACIENDYCVTGMVSEEVDQAGSSMWISNNIMGVVEGDRLMRVWGTQVDVTETKRAEQRQARLQVELARGQRLESLGRLAGGVAHDLNNLLAPILGYAELLRELDELSEDRRDMLDGILQAAFRARDLVAQLLVFGRKQTFESGPVVLGDVVTRFEPLLRRTIPEDIDLRIEHGADLEPIFADVGQIERVLMNLAVNAADAMESGGTLAVATRMVDVPEGAADGGASPGRYVVLSVRDTGCGMDASVQAQAFEPFFSTKGDLGTGLGLAMVYGIVRQHGGFVVIESEPGVGTNIEVHLPAVQAVTAPDDDDDAMTPEVFGSETILVVEDEPHVRAATRKCLERLGYEVLAAEDGEHALALLDDDDVHVDLLLTDVIMPGLNGRQLVESARARRPGLKSLFMSGYADPVLATRGVHHPDVAFIHKPFTKVALSQKLRAVLDGAPHDARRR